MAPCTRQPRLILASTSPYRRDLLARLGQAFEVQSPGVDEDPREGEPPATLADRLARAKAEVVACANPGAWVIGSDQVAELDGHALGKPHRRDAAVAQLQALSGRQARFYTAQCLSRATPEGDLQSLHSTDLTVVRFRHLLPDEIERYLDTEQPLDCAGSFKCEGLGIGLFEAIETSDPTALVGLPLIATARHLREAGFRVP
ncbi:Maf family protein [Lysobacter sp. A3-1-A15]|uniref:Maf family protein n=1 Tax=Novilysobacter viscosus TaxID=3098602 RepID=UPI002ED84A36